MAATKWQKRVDTADWDAVATEINDVGGALLPQLVTKTEAAAIRGLYPDDGLFRATIEMSRYRFGEGEYRYFRRPYPGADRRTQTCPVPTAAADRTGLVAQAGPARTVAGSPRRMARNVPCGGTDQVDGHPAQVRTG